MSKPTSKRKSSSRKQQSKAVARRTSRPQPASRAPSKPSNRAGTKHAKIIDLLSSAAGATVAAMSDATGWQQHSVRGFLAGVIRKKLQLNLVSEVGPDGRIYRIVAATSTQAA